MGSYHCGGAHEKGSGCIMPCYDVTCIPLKYEILKPISRKSIYDALPGSPPGAKCAEVLKRYEAFDKVFSAYYNFTASIPLNEGGRLNDWLEAYPADLQWFIDQGFIGVVKPAFIPFKLPIETEEEADWLTVDLSWLRPTDKAYPIRQRLNAIYSPTRTDGGKG